MTHPPQIHHPQNPSFYTLQDLKRNRLISGTLFNVLFNLNKFVQFETRDPFQARQVRNCCCGGGGGV